MQAILLLVVGGAVLWIGLVKFELEKPTITISPDSGYVGRNMTVKVADRKSGVAEVRVEAVQKGKAVTLLAEHFPKGAYNVEKQLSMQPMPQGLTDGETQFKIFARDHSWFKGNPVTLEKNIVIDTLPPQLTILGALHSFNQGGTGFVTYQASEEMPVTGVQAGDLFFRGYPAGKDHYFVYFTLGYDRSKKVAIQAVGEDLAGNRTETGIRLIRKAKAFKRDKIQITESFLQNVTPYFTKRDPSLRGTPLEVFLTINRKQREADHLTIKKICQQTENQPLWSGRFLRLPNSKSMASFAESRTYWHKGKEIDRQIHLGVDLASLAQSPIPAANSGRVAFAGPLGIYGNTIIIDHGCGLFSMYSHLSKIKTEVKKEVKKGETLGHTGATGLAGGDHLHFSMLVNGYFVNPIEWWDAHWIRENIERKMKF